MPDVKWKHTELSPDLVQKFLADPALGELRKVVASLEKKHAPDYDNPNWAHRQAHDNGFNEAINRVLNLIKLEG